MISNEAVEAAARAAYNLTHTTKWVQLSLGYKRELMLTARAALEAAAPHMLAEAWMEGEAAGYVNHAAEHRGDEYANPYRMQR